MTTNLPCPECGSLLTIDEEARVSEPFWVDPPTITDRVAQWRVVRASVGFCSGCEFSIVVERRWAFRGQGKESREDD